MKGNVRNKEIVRKALKDVEAVFHLAAIVAFSFSVKNPFLVNEVNVGGSVNVLDESVRRDMKRKGLFMRHLALFIVSLLICLSMKNIPQSLCRLMLFQNSLPRNTVRFFNKVYGLRTDCLRFFNVYGLRQKGSFYGGVVETMRWREN